jgi:hypothetical protein
MTSSQEDLPVTGSPGGNPGSGKTTLALQFLLHHAFGNRDRAPGDGHFHDWAIPASVKILNWYRLCWTMGGGVESGSSTLVIGPAGAGKSILLFQFVAAAIKRGEHAAIFAFDEELGLLLRGLRRSALIWKLCATAASSISHRFRPSHPASVAGTSGAPAKILFTSGAFG